MINPRSVALSLVTWSMIIETPYVMIISTRLRGRCMTARTSFSFRDLIGMKSSSCQSQWWSSLGSRSSCYSSTRNYKYVPMVSFCSTLVTEGFETLSPGCFSNSTAANASPSAFATNFGSSTQIYCKSHENACSTPAAVEDCPMFFKLTPSWRALY